MKSLLKTQRKTRSAAPSRYSGAVTALAVIALWFLFAPFQVGGWASYVIVNGNSMEPDFHRGDLVITRVQSSGYGVGDIVAYSHPDIGPVIHRIVAEDDGRFTLRGDNNDWLDSYRPVESEMIGESWLHIPSAGKFLGAMHSPAGILVLSLIMGVIVMMSFPTDKSSKNRNGRNRRGDDGRDLSALTTSQAGAKSPPGTTGKDAEGILTMFGAVLLASIVLGFFAFTRPATIPVSGDTDFRNTGEFSYTANVPSDVYESGRIESGEPVFRDVTDNLSVSFDYRLDTPLPTEDIRGTYRLDARVSDVSGWSRTFPLRGETPFSGGEFKATGILDLSDIQDSISRFEEQTGFETDRYSVSVVPDVEIGGELGGQPVEDGFSPSLDFWLDDTQMQLQVPVAQGAASADLTALGTDEPTADPLSPSEDGSASSAATEGNSISIFGFEIGVAFARVVSVAGVLGASAGMVFFGLPVLRARRSGDEPTRIAASHGGSLVSVRDNPFGEGPVINLSTFEDLDKVASMAEQKILYSHEDGVHDYYVLDAGNVYGYRAVVVAEGDDGGTDEHGNHFIEMVREMWR